MCLHLCSMWAHCRAESLTQETTLLALASVMGTHRQIKLAVEAPSLISRDSGIYPACIVTPEHSLSTRASVRGTGVPLWPLLVCSAFSSLLSLSRWKEPAAPGSAEVHR